MFCKSCGQELPNEARWCSGCGTPVTVRPDGGPSGASGASAAAAPAPDPNQAADGPSLSRHIGDEVKARSRDAWSGIKLFAKSPVGGLPQSYAMFEPERAMQVGIAFAVIYEITFFIGMYMMASRAAGIFGIGVRVSDASIGLLFKVILVGLVPFASLVGASVLARKMFRGSGILAGDFFTAGASLLPFGIAVLITAILGAANFEVIVVLFVFALSYNILMLYSGCSHIAGIPESGAAPAVPVMLLVSAWLTKVIIAAMM
jgi:hypothetical protein